MKNLVVADVSVLLPDMEIRNHQTVEAADGKIIKIRPFQQEDRKEDRKDWIDGRGKLLMPGLADCHMHTGQQLLKGKILDELPMIWTRIMLPFESTLTEQKMELSAKLAALEMIKSGTTAFIDEGSYYMVAVVEVNGITGL